jgi:hypothetical protein
MPDDPDTAEPNPALPDRRELHLQKLPKRVASRATFLLEPWGGRPAGAVVVDLTPEQLAEIGDRGRPATEVEIGVAGVAMQLA